MHLLILNYCMDEEDPVLSHQIQAALELNKYFDKVTVLTGKIGNDVKFDSIKVYSSEWVQGNKIKSVFCF